MECPFRPSLRPCDSVRSLTDYNHKTPDKTELVVQELAAIFPDSIRDPASTRPPNISRVELYSVLQEYIGTSDETVNMIVARILVINDKMGAMTVKQLFGRETPAARKMQIYNKARHRNFYLNMESKYKWVAML